MKKLNTAQAELVDDTGEVWDIKELQQMAKPYVKKLSPEYVKTPEFRYGYLCGRIDILDCFAEKIAAQPDYEEIAGKLAELKIETGQHDRCDPPNYYVESLIEIIGEKGINQIINALVASGGGE